MEYIYSKSLDGKEKKRTRKALTILQKERKTKEGRWGGEKGKGRGRKRKLENKTRW